MAATEITADRPWELFPGVFKSNKALYKSAVKRDYRDAKQNGKLSLVFVNELLVSNIF